MSDPQRNRIKTRAFILKQILLRRKAYRYFNELMRNQFRSSEEISEINWIKRQHLLKHAYENIPFYKRRFESLDLDPRGICHQEDWNSVPLLIKSDLREHFDDIVLPDSQPRDRSLSTTGGSTGEPVSVYSDRRFQAEALGWRMLSWWGLKPGTDIAITYRLPRKTRLQKLVNRAIWWPTRRLWLDASSMDTGSVKRFVRQFNAVKPPLLYGYVGAVRHVAGFVEKNGINVHPPQAIWVTSAPISVVERTFIEEVFKAPVYDQYGSGEVSWLASECAQHSGLHVFSDARYVEFLDSENRPCPAGQEGRIVVTDLENHVFPLIRYEIGDLGRQLAGRCSCGVNLPLMAPVKGRIPDNLPLPDGTVIAGTYLTQIFDDYPQAVRAYQVYQKRDCSITVRAVLNKNYENAAAILEKVRAALMEKTEGQVLVDSQVVDEIPSDQGKTRFVVSEVPGIRDD